MKKHGKKGRHGTLRVLLLAVYSVLLIRHSERIADGVRTALARCINVIVPSLFAFLAAADMLVRGGAYIYLSKPLKPFSRLTGLPDELGPLFLVSNAAGYPAGAAAVKAMYDEGRIGKESASRLVCFCFGGGPAFFAGAVGTAVFGSARVGLIVWLTNFAANILAAAVICRLFPIEVRKARETAPAGDMLTEAVAAAGRALFGICGTIMLFSTFLTLTEIFCGRLGLDREHLGVLSAFLEISEVAELRGGADILPLVCAAGAFGGICVLLQVRTIVGGRFSLLPFAVTRLVCAVTAALIALPLKRFVGAIAVQAAAVKPVSAAERTFPVICLIMMILLTSVKVFGGQADTGNMHNIP